MSPYLSQSLLRGGEGPGQDVGPPGTTSSVFSSDTSREVFGGLGREDGLRVYPFDSRSLLALDGLQGTFQSPAQPWVRRRWGLGLGVTRRDRGPSRTESGETENKAIAHKAAPGPTSRPRRRRGGCPRRLPSRRFPRVGSRSGAALSATGRYLTVSSATRRRLRRSLPGPAPPLPRPHPSTPQTHPDP